MAFTAPTNFKCDKTSIVIGEPLTFTWNAASGDFTAYRLMSSSIKNFIVSKTTTSCSVTVTPDSGWGELFVGRDIVFSVCAYKGENYYGEETETVWCENTITLYITSLGGGDTPEPPTPPVPSATGRLEQFQNSAGEQIYPRTIIEGIFRQSDKKTLADILAGISAGDIDLSLYAPKASPVFTGSISMGRKAGTVIGESSFAVGSDAEASGINSHAEGIECVASGRHCHAEGGGCTASENCDHAEGYYTKASGGGSHAEGRNTTASALCSHAEGIGTIASAAGQSVIGTYNVEYAGAAADYSNYSALFIIGKGEETPLARANAFRVATTGVYAAGSYNASGADYAEMFEWSDGNPDSEDRAGLFVTLDGAKIRLAGPEDDYILGVVSGNPSVVGDVHDDQWRGMYLYDIFGRPLWENAEDSNHTERRQKLNPNYDNTQKYTPRSQRPEWSAVGMLGKLVAVDDGTCQVNGWCTVGKSGIATASESRTKYRVMERLDENHIRVMIL